MGLQNNENIQEIFLVFPHQIFKKLPSGNHIPIALIEDDLFFGQIRFHKKKLVFHRASMQFYQNYLTKRGKTTLYYSHNQHPSLKPIIEALHQKGVRHITTYQPDDYLLEKRINRYCKQLGIELSWLPSPSFLLKRSEVLNMLENKKNYLLFNFYKKLRKNSGVLMNGLDPVGGQWSFDNENRSKINPRQIVPSPPVFGQNKFVAEATIYVDKYYPNNPGHTTMFDYPVTFDEAAEELENFLANRFMYFGNYQDALSNKTDVLYHSRLSIPMNAGLIDPATVVNSALPLAKERKVPINSLEGFIRQILGWREFIRGVYHRDGSTMRNSNYFGFDDAPLSFELEKGHTGIPIYDHTIQKMMDRGYLHHIERLMVLGNLQLLCRSHPNRVYTFFMQYFIDAYDWVMVPNVYGMSQYADGGLITTKPYISGSNYLRKMGASAKGNWQNRWDALYWSFLADHKNILKNNPRMRMMYHLLEKMPAQKLNELKKQASISA